MKAILVYRLARKVRPLPFIVIILKTPEPICATIIAHISTTFNHQYNLIGFSRNLITTTL